MGLGAGYKSLMQVYLREPSLVVEVGEVYLEERLCQSYAKTTLSCFEGLETDFLWVASKQVELEDTCRTVKAGWSPTAHCFQG